MPNEQFLVRVSHADGSMNIGPLSLEDARTRAKLENETWVRWWSTKTRSGQRPTIQIWKMFEEVSEPVKGIDPAADAPIAKAKSFLAKWIPALA